jgi:hypothetical protein
MLARILLTPSVMTVSRGTGVDCFSLTPSLRGAERRSNPVFLIGLWIASLRSQ